MAGALGQCPRQFANCRKLSWPSTFSAPGLGPLSGNCLVAFFKVALRAGLFFFFPPLEGEEGKKKKKSFFQSKKLPKEVLHAAICFPAFKVCLSLWCIRFLCPFFRSGVGRLCCVCRLSPPDTSRAFRPFLGRQASIRLQRLRAQAVRGPGLGFHPGSPCLGPGRCPSRRRPPVGSWGSSRLPAGGCLWWGLGVVSPVFPSRALARAWAVACGVAPHQTGATVQACPGGFRANCAGSPAPSCLFCLALGRCEEKPGPGCGFIPSRWWQSRQGSLF